MPVGQLHQIQIGQNTVGGLQNILGCVEFVTIRCGQQQLAAYRVGEQLIVHVLHDQEPVTRQLGR